MMATNLELCANLITLGSDGLELSNACQVLCLLLVILANGCQVRLHLNASEMSTGNATNEHNREERTCFT